MADLTPLQRRAELHRMLSSRKRVVASELAKDWACNERTVRRTLEKMRDEQHLPIEFDPIEQTWRYTTKVEEIPAALVSAADRRALLFSLQATILRIAKDAPPYVRDRVWSDGEQRRQDDEGRIVVEFPTAAVFAVEREVRAEGGWVEVMQPTTLREKIRQAAEMLAKAHA